MYKYFDYVVHEGCAIPTNDFFTLLQILDRVSLRRHLLAVEGSVRVRRDSHAGSTYGGRRISPQELDKNVTTA